MCCFRAVFDPSVFPVGRLDVSRTRGPPDLIVITSCFENGNVREPPTYGIIWNTVARACVSSTHRGPRPGKGRHSRTKRSPSPTADGGDRPGGGPEALRPITVACATPCSQSSSSVTPGYEQYQKSLLEVPWRHAEYGEASSDDLSSEWDSDVPEPPPNQKVNDGTLVDGCYVVKLHLWGHSKMIRGPGEKSQIYCKTTVATCYNEFCNYVRLPKLT